MQAELQKLRLIKQTTKRPPATPVAKSAAAKVPAKSAKPKASNPPEQPEPEEEEDAEQDAEGEEEDDEEALTEAALRARRRRLCERKPSGKLNVPESVHEIWLKGGDARKELEKALAEVNFQKDTLSTSSTCFSLVFSFFLPCLAG